MRCSGKFGREFRYDEAPVGDPGMLWCFGQWFPEFRSRRVRILVTVAVDQRSKPDMWRFRGVICSEREVIVVQVGQRTQRCPKYWPSGVLRPRKGSNPDMWRFRGDSRFDSGVIWAEWVSLRRGCPTHRRSGILPRLHRPRYAGRWVRAVHKSMEATRPL